MLLFLSSTYYVESIISQVEINPKFTKCSKEVYFFFNGTDFQQPTNPEKKMLGKIMLQKKIGAKNKIKH
jgi:hypothetical protein